jgi:hypothetical protein
MYYKALSVLVPLIWQQSRELCGAALCADKAQFALYYLLLAAQET